MGGEWWVWHDLSMENEWIVGYICSHGFDMSNNVILIGGTWCWCG